MITVKKLVPELANVFTDFIAGLDFGHEPHWASCYCRFYHTNCSYDEWEGRTGSENRREALDAIQQGHMTGYLAFNGEQCIGWCNANHAREYIRIQEHMAPVIGDKKIGCIMCFVIHPEYRNQGIARLMIKNAIHDFKAEGYEGVLAAPIENIDDPVKKYRGTVNMYLENNFVIIQELGDMKVMYLEFN